MTAFAEDRAGRWEPFGVSEADFAAVPERDGARVVNLTLGSGGRRGARWLRAAAAALGVLAAAAAAVSWQAQYAMVWAVKQHRWVAALEAGIPDAGAVVFAALGIALALHGKRALRPRALNAACVGISLVMNALAADPGWKNLAIWVMPSALYALASDTLIGVVRAWVLARARNLGETLAEDGPTPLAVAGGAALWLLRLSLAPRSTLGGFRSWVVTDCPVAPGLRPGHAAELEAARRDGDQRAALAAAERDEAVARAAGQARQAREEAARALAAEASLQAELDRIRSDAGQRAAQALADAAREREELRAWALQLAGGLRAELGQVREDAARQVSQAQDAAAARVAAVEEAGEKLRAERDRLAAQLRTAADCLPPERSPRPRQPGKAGPTKRDRMIELAWQRRDLATIPLAGVSRLAGTVAEEIGYSAGTARRELVRHVRELQDAAQEGTSDGDGGQAR